MTFTPQVSSGLWAKERAQHLVIEGRNAMTLSSSKSEVWKKNKISSSSFDVMNEHYSSVFALETQYFGKWPNGHLYI